MYLFLLDKPFLNLPIYYFFGVNEANISYEATCLLKRLIPKSHSEDPAVVAVTFMLFSIFPLS
ncbi:hypothetical protein [Flavobacterium collinsii]|uniref:hypothetical protein n=1 Tax=Flavobacterium collinsii TaxID=1114861 RepID=UPI0021E026F3|nr:hypothetical protein [Flavobacterium collinsii]